MNYGLETYQMHTKSVPKAQKNVVQNTYKKRTKIKVQKTH